MTFGGGVAVMVVFGREVVAKGGKVVTEHQMDAGGALVLATCGESRKWRPTIASDVGCKSVF